MKRLLALLLTALLLAACSEPAEQTEPSTIETTRQTDPSTVETTRETEPPHSELYIPGIEAEAVIRWFSEVCLDAEIVNSGDPSRLQKWDSPISFRVEGSPTQEDLDTLSAFSALLDTIPGFPGLREAEANEAASLDIRFCTQEEMVLSLGEWAWECDGGVTFWYEEDRIYAATLCVRTELDQALRSSVLLEELYNCLGPIQDTTLREDSIIYSGFSQPQWLTEVDRLILTLLYHPDMKIGMDAGQCAQVIRSLYY